MTTFNHPTFGMIGGAPSEDGAIFNPLNWLTCPGNMRRALRYGERRAARAGALDGLSGRVRAARAEDCGQMFVRVLMDRDYGPKRSKGGEVIRRAITEDEVGIALLGAAKFCDRAGWRDGSGHRQNRRKKYPLISSMSATGDNPAALASLIESAARTRLTNDARDALCGLDEEEKTGETVAVEGGQAYPELDGKMVADDTRRAWIDAPGENEDGTAFRFAQRQLPTGWRMDRRKAHKPEVYAPCVVADACDTDAPRPRYAGHAPLPRAIPAQPGDGTAWRGLPFDLTAELAKARATLLARAQG